jgi:hypothetical protein
MHQHVLGCFGRSIGDCCTRSARCANRSACLALADPAAVPAVPGICAGAHWRYVVRWERLEADVEGLGRLQVCSHCCWSFLFKAQHSAVKLATVEWERAGSVESQQPDCSSRLLHSQLSYDAWRVCGRWQLRSREPSRAALH